MCDSKGVMIAKAMQVNAGFAIRKAPKTHNVRWDVSHWELYHVASGEVITRNDLDSLRASFPGVRVESVATSNMQNT